MHSASISAVAILAFGLGAVSLGCSSGADAEGVGPLPSSGDDEPLAGDDPESQGSTTASCSTGQCSGTTIRVPRGCFARAVARGSYRCCNALCTAQGARGATALCPTSRGTCSCVFCL